MPLLEHPFEGDTTKEMGYDQNFVDCSSLLFSPWNKLCINIFEFPGSSSSKYPPKDAQHPNAPKSDATSVNHCHQDQLFITCHTHAVFCYCWPCPCTGTVPRPDRFPFGKSVPLACTYRSLGTQLPVSPGGEQGSRGSTQKAQCLPPALARFHPSTSALQCQSVCEQKHRANMQRRRIHFPTAIHPYECSPFPSSVLQRSSQSLCELQKE